MYIQINSIGSKVPSWIATGMTEYQKRFPHSLQCVIKEFPLEIRSKNTDREQIRHKESECLFKAAPKDSFLVCLDERGKNYTSQDLTLWMKNSQENHQPLCFLIGGPDGISSSIIKKSNARWAFGQITLPHMFVRLILVEQIYRGWTILQGHPYHRI